MQFRETISNFEARVDVIVGNMNALNYKNFFAIIPLLLGFFSLSFIPVKSKVPEHQIIYLQKSSITMASMAQVDSKRQKNFSKITKIITRYNRKMPSSTRQALASEIIEMSIKYPNLDVPLICATITHESARTWNPRAVSPVGAMGLMQIMPRTGKWLAKYEGIKWTNTRKILFDPIINIRLGARYLSTLIDTYELEGGLAAYNGGWKRAKLWLSKGKADGILWAETRSYIPNVLKLYEQYKRKPF